MVHSLPPAILSVSSLPVPTPNSPSKTSFLTKDFFSTHAFSPSSWDDSLTVVLLKYSSIVGVLGGIVVVISGLAINLLGVVGIGGFLTFNSILGLYSAYLFASLKDLDAYNRELFDLNQNLQQKNQEIQNLNGQLSQILADFSSIQQKYQQLIKEDQAAQENLHHQLTSVELELKQTVETFNKAQTDASTTLTNTIDAFKKQDGELHKVIDDETAQITLLKKTLDQAKAENDRLHEKVVALQRLLTDYVQQNKEYAKQNELLQQQIRALGQLPTRPLPVDISSVTTHAKVLQDLLVHQNSEADKVIQAADQLKEIMARIDALKTQRKSKNESEFKPVNFSPGGT